MFEAPTSSTTTLYISMFIYQTLYTTQPASNGTVRNSTQKMISAGTTRLCHDQRKAILARDPLACVYGFHVLVGLIFRHIFGLHFCPRCPDCAASSTPCMDAFGSSSTAVGGVFGRVDAVYGSLECQKSGAYHMHAQLFVECYHQFTPLQDLMRLGAEPRLELLRKHSSYTAHVRRTIYSNPKAWQEEEQADVEAQWPEYRESHLMLSRPLYQKDADMEPQDWKVIYLNTDVEALQKHKQHHVHLPDAAGKRQPLHHCRDPKDPTKCKSG